MDNPLIACILMTVMTTGLVRPITAQAWSYQDIEYASHSQSEQTETSDYRFVSYRLNLKTGSSFKNKNLISLVQLLIDEKREQILVGGRDSLYRLRLDNLSLLQHTPWKPSQKARTTCQDKGRPDERCHNFIRVLSQRPDGGQVFVCGTNAFSPRCQERNATDLSHVIATKDGRAISPYDPHFNATSLITKSGDVYVGLATDFHSRDSAIFRHHDKGFLRSMRDNTRWLNSPSFVSSYEILNYVYFFFREEAVENINCGRTDKGSFHVKHGSASTTFNSFAKARLNCSLPASHPFYFDELQSTYYSEDTRLLYAVFTTPPVSIVGSAVCVFHLDAIEDVFMGDFKHHDTVQSTWTRHKNEYPYSKCYNNGSYNVTLDEFMSSKKYQLMDSAVPTTRLGPLVMREGERWTHIVVDRIPIRGNNRRPFDVIFLATSHGTLRKMMRLPKSNAMCLIEEIKIARSHHRSHIKNMRLLHKQAIYLATEGEILKIPVERCYRFTTRLMCVNAQDPYCGWNAFTKSCTPAPNGDPNSDGWYQDIKQCPVLTLPIDGGWTKFSQWEVCRHAGHHRHGNQCLCRSRTCTRPDPAFGGKECRGTPMEVSNCTVNGGWTAWRDTTACERDCGRATKTRRRECTKPSPRFGGRKCRGNAQHRITCKDNPPCKPLPTHGRWSPWSQWSACSKKCNAGFQMRRRSCNKPAPRRGGNPCVGNKQEWRQCNTQACEAITHLVPWTDWFRINETRHGTFKQRFRFRCRARARKDGIRITSDFASGETKFCDSNSEQPCFGQSQIPNAITSGRMLKSVDLFLVKYCRKRKGMFNKHCTC